MKIAALLIFIGFSSICFAQSVPIIIELNDGSIHTYDISEIQGIEISGGLTGIEEEQLVQTVINSFVVHQNYPNPFNPGTNIVYEIPHPGLVEINIFNIRGQLVYSFGSTEKGKGVYTVSWDGRNDSGTLVSSGVYFYRIHFNNNFFTKKMLLIR